MKTVLIVAAGNSLSHLGKALALYTALRQQGFRALIAACGKYAPALERLEIPFLPVSDLPETNRAAPPFPAISWFAAPRSISGCIREEIALLERCRPDAVIGIFRFTLKAAAQNCGIPFYSLSCGCLLPENDEPLGFPGGLQDSDRQRTNIDYFFRYAGSRIRQAAQRLGISLRLDDAREMLRGRLTFLWDFPEFMPIKHQRDLLHCGPIDWHDWPYDEIDYAAVPDRGKPLALVSFGTCNYSREVLTRTVDNLSALGYQVIFSTGWQTATAPRFSGRPGAVTGVGMLPLAKLLPFADLLVCHGGQLSIFAALRARVPVLVIPFQPEQAHNALCLERLGCGRSLVRPVLFHGRSDVYQRRLDELRDIEFQEQIQAFTGQPELSRRLQDASQILRRYRGVESVVENLRRELGDA